MDDRSEQAVDPGVCPLCGGDNGCGAVAGKPPGSCWCSAAHFPPSLLESLPERALGKACICRSCVERLESVGESSGTGG